MRLTTAVAALAGAAGLAVAATLSSIPPGLGAARPMRLLALVGGEPVFPRALVAAALVIAVVLGGGAAALRRRTGVGRAAAMSSLEPLLWGCALPGLALLTDPWSFHRTAPPLAAAGIALGILGVTTRLRAALAAAPRPAGRGTSAAGLTMGGRLGMPIVLALAAVLIPATLVLPGPPWFHPISGDEPHYLVIARSLWIDGDLDVANEYADELTSPFWPAELAPHAKPGIDPSTRYSIHGSGLAVWLAPWFGAGRSLSEIAFTVLVRFAMALWLGAGAICLFLLLRDIAGEVVATRGTLLAVFTLPLLFAGPHLFPAIPVFTLSCGAYWILRRRPGVAGALAAGLMLACLPWLHFKFFGLMAAISATGIASLLAHRREKRPIRPITALLAPLMASSIGHAAFTWALYGRLSPLAIHVGADSSLRATAAGDDWLAYISDPGGAVTTAIGYLMDQREGLLFYAPHYLLAAAGLAWLLEHRRRDAWAMGLAFAAVAGPYALSQEIGHWGPPARPLTGVLWTLAVPMGIALMLPAGAGVAGRWRAATRGLLIGWGVGATVLLLLQADLLYHDFNVARSLVLLRYGAPGLALADAAPLWLGPEAVRWGPSLAWLLAAGALATFFWRWGRRVSPARRPTAGRSTPERRSATTGAESWGSVESTHVGIGLRSAVGLIVAAAAVMLWHHVRVPVTALHEPWTHGEVRYWKPESPPTRAWVAERGVWTGGGDTVRLLISSREPIEAITFEVASLVPMGAELQVGRDRQALRVGPDVDLGGRLARFAPGPGRLWDGEYFYHLEVVAARSASPASLGQGDDGRGLGIHLQVVQLEADR